MIRRDYIMRQVQEMAQVLTRALFLRSRGDYEMAVREIGRALRTLGDPPANPLDVEGWLRLCRQHEGVTGPLMNAVGLLIREEAQSLAGLGRAADARRTRSLALTLQLEALITESIPVTLEVLEQLDRDIGELNLEELEPATLGRLMMYYEERGRLAAAEDVLFEWVERKDPAVAMAGRAFYGRLAVLAEEQLIAGGLSREEVEQGRRDLDQKLLARPDFTPIP